jgi:hypothetical protein|tara:strand:- start:388 stop:888 length:501 start_codon:yes stop_codon:yes gene_type:complete
MWGLSKMILTLNMNLLIIIALWRGLLQNLIPAETNWSTHKRKENIMVERTVNKHINTFKTFCKNNRLRLREAGDGLPVAKAIGKFKEDQFFCNFKDGTIGVYVTRETQRQFTYLHKKLTKLGCVATQLGDFEGAYDLEWMNIPPVARLLKIKKGAAKVKDPKWLRE